MSPAPPDIDPDGDAHRGPVRRWLGPRALAALVLALGLALTYALWRAESRHAQSVLRADFEFRVREAAGRVEQRIAAHEQLLRGVAGLFDASGRLAAAALRPYVKALRLEHNFSDIEGIGVIVAVPHARLAEHVAEQRRLGFEDYQVWPEAGSGPQAPLVAMEPGVEHNRRALGYNAFADPVRRAALEQARDSGRMSISGKLAVDSRGARLPDSGLMMVVPLYVAGGTPNTVDDRRRQHAGWVVMSFRVAEMLRDVFGERHQEIDVEIYDGDRASIDVQMFDADGVASTLEPRPSTLTATRALTVPGRTWTLLARAQPSFVARHDTHNLPLVVAAGIGSSLVLAWLAWVLAAGRERIEAQTRRMERQLLATEARVHELGNHLPGSFIYQIARDADGSSHILYISSGVARVLGVTPEEVLADADALLGRIDPAQVPEYQVAKDRSLMGLTDFSMDLRMRAAGGDWRWLHINSRPRNEDGGRIVWDSAATDITDRKWAEDALRLSEERWAFAIEGSGDGVWDWNVATGEVQFSRRWKAMLGCAEHELQPSFEEWKDRIHPDDLARTLQAVQDYLDGRRPSYAIEHRLACKGGGWKWILARGMLIAQDPDGRPLRMIGTHTDISESKRTEFALRESESRFRSIIDASPVPNALTDDLLSVTMLNPAFVQAFGYQLEQVPTLKHWALRALPEPGPRRRLLVAWNRRLRRLRREGGRFEPLEMPIRCADGEARSVLASAALLDGAFAGTYLVTMDDITERKRAAQAQRESEQRFRDLVDSTDGIVWEADALSRQFTYVSDQALRLLGHPIEDWKAPGFWAAHIHPEDRQRAIDHSAERAAALQPHDLELRMLARDGSAVWLRDIVNVVAEDGRARWLRGVMVDITRHKRLEAELQEMATTDVLTRLANRRHFMARLEGEHARLTRSPSEPSTVLVFDIDHFKGINDRLGHAAGDAVLREIGARVREELRRSDTAGRIGGEEFAMILSGTPAATAWHFAERLRRKIADAPIVIDGGAVTVTISVGLAAMSPSHGSADVALRRADEAMYRAKRDGRNRVEPTEAEGQVRDQPVEG